MDAKKVLTIITLVVEGIEVVIKGVKLVEENYKNQYGFIHKRVPAIINGEKGFLIWDYILYNEITFKSEQGEIWSFFTSASDKETQVVWEELEKKYGTEVESSIV